MDREKVLAAAKVAARAGAPAEGEEQRRAARGRDPARDSRLRAEEKPALRQGPAFAPAAAPSRLTSGVFPAPV